MKRKTSRTHERPFNLPVHLRHFANALGPLNVPGAKAICDGTGYGDIVNKDGLVLASVFTMKVNGKDQVFITSYELSAIASDTFDALFDVPVNYCSRT